LERISVAWNKTFADVRPAWSDYRPHLVFLRSLVILLRQDPRTSRGFGGGLPFSFALAANILVLETRLRCGNNDLNYSYPMPKALLSTGNPSLSGRFSILAELLL
jgi:hypothetical protein